jgi:hypothetical protein
MQNIAGKITIGNSTLRLGKNSRIVAIDVQCALNIPAHRGRIIADAPAGITAKPGDLVQVELGPEIYPEIYDDAQVNRIFTGRVHSLAAGLTHLQVEALSAFSLLAAAHINLVYEKQTAREIVDDVLRRVKVKAGKLEPGVRFAAYTLSAGRSAWANLQGLAEQCGFDFYADADDCATFAAWKPTKVHDCRYGTNILEYTWENVPEPFAGVEVYGESPAGQGQSDEAAPWLTKKEVKGRAGQSRGNVLRLVDPIARNQNLAGEIARRQWQRYNITARGHVRLVGTSAIRLGDAIRLVGAPGAQSGLLRVIGVRHRLNSALGFVTDIDWEKR